jgi:uncharacterized membrane protein YccF (DUF307 family)
MKTLLNIIWLVLSGIWLFLGYMLAALIMCVLVITIPWGIALGHLLSGIALCITIIGIPFGIANFKLIPVALLPLGNQIVDTP